MATQLHHFIFQKEEVQLTITKQYMKIYRQKERKCLKIKEVQKEKLAFTPFCHPTLIDGSLGLGE